MYAVLTCTYFISAGPLGATRLRGKMSFQRCLGSLAILVVIVVLAILVVIGVIVLLAIMLPGKHVMLLSRAWDSPFTTP